TSVAPLLPLTNISFYIKSTKKLTLPIIFLSILFSAITTYPIFSQSNYNFILVSHPTQQVPWQKLMVEGSYLYLGASYYGFYVFDSNPFNPIVLGSVWLNMWPVDIDAENNYVYVANSDSGLRIIDVSTPASPFIVSTFKPANDRCKRVKVKNSYAYVVYVFSNSLEIIDASNPSSPSLAGQVNITNPASAIFIQDHYLYVAENGVGIKIFDITDPLNVQLTGLFATSGANTIFVSGNYIYAAYGFWLMIIDITDPQSPFEVGLHNNGVNIQDLHISNQRAFLLGNNGDVIAIDVSNPQQMQEVGYYNYTDISGAFDLHSVGDYVYIAHGDARGVVIKYEGNTGIEPDASSLQGFRLFQNYPNPFNPNTTIRYNLPKALSVNLKIHTITGQAVKTLVSRIQPSGEYDVQWDGRDNTGKAVASGVYLYQLKAGEFVESRKMVLLR
ncbi:MAG: T9SS type A sorting domain-containing protein, partial [Calditrichia bacterium]|nr:T9SS type A sorting domain-containing protein [Calditrichia bacterium]